MSGDRERDRSPNDRLLEMLRAATPEPPLDAVDWDRLHARVMAGAKPILARTPVRSWWDVAAAWAARGIPLTAAAAAAAALALGLGTPRADRPAPGDVASDFTPVTVEEVLAGEAGALLLAATEDDVLVTAFLDFDGEEW
jgi:hypothetical protein